MSMTGQTLSILLDIICLSVGAPAHAYILFKIFKMKNFCKFYPLEMNVVAISALACLLFIPIDVTDKFMTFFGHCLGNIWYTAKNFMFSALTNTMILTLVFISFHRIQRVRESLRAERTWSFLVNAVEVITSWSIGILTAVIQIIDSKHAWSSVHTKGLGPSVLHNRSLTNDAIGLFMFLTLMASLAACWILVLRYIRLQRRVQPTALRPSGERSRSQDSKDVQLDFKNDDDIASTVTAFDGNIEQNLDDVMIATTNQTSRESRTESLIESIIDNPLESPNSLMSHNSSKFKRSCQREELASGHVSRSRSDVPPRGKFSMRLSQATSCISDSVLTNGKQKKPSIQEKRNSFRMSKSKSSKYLYTQSTTASIGSVKKILRRSMSFTEHMEDTTECKNARPHKLGSSESMEKTTTPKNHSEISHQRVSSEQIDTKIEKVSDDRTWTRSDSTMSRQGSIEFRLFEKQNFRESIANNDELDLSLKSFSVHDLDLEENRHGQVFLSPEQPGNRMSTITRTPEEKIEVWYVASERESEEIKSQETKTGPLATIGENPVQIKITRPSTDCNQLMMRRHGIHRGVSMMNIRKSRDDFHRSVVRAQGSIQRSVSPTIQVSKRMILAILLSLVVMPAVFARVFLHMTTFPAAIVVDILGITGSISNLIFTLAPYLYILYNKSITKLLFVPHRQSSLQI